MIVRALRGGFTLIEMVTVIAISGVVAAMVAVFLKYPMQQYTDTARRAELTDIADTALRRIGRDLRMALPNSVRVTGSCGGGNDCTLEFIPTTGGGRYRAGVDGAGAGNVLDFETADSSFEMFGTPPQMTNGTHQIVVYNLGVQNADAYSNAAENRTAYQSIAGQVVTVAAKQFPYDSPGHRFHVVTSPVKYVCDPVSGTLTRESGYGWPEATTTGTSNVLASKVSKCIFSYDPLTVAGRYGLVTMNLTITDSGEAVSLYSATHVSNQP
ncbi:MAG TPA: prepilin-type N-terminal cleavage/methylation domain-containing protein [Paucimonas sp.]|nr:prepilin-type N-terminal cleavage/methylation domain-containing protein [Paucimonas sp.]